MDAYKQAMSQNYEWQKLYQKDVPTDTGITSGEGYNIHADPAPPYILTAAALQEGTSPLYTNPAAYLYTSGHQNRVLLSASQSICDSGCVVPVKKPDPRVFQVKPLYQPYVFSAPEGHAFPTAYNVVGMY